MSKVLSKISSKYSRKLIELAVLAHKKVLTAKVADLANKSRLARVAVDQHDEFVAKVLDTRGTLVKAQEAAFSEFIRVNGNVQDELASLGAL